MRVGIDEAGRGPIIGPMVMVGFADSNNLPEGVKDSKLLSKKQREYLFEKLVRFKHCVKIVEPSVIDARVAVHELNHLEADTSAQIAIDLGCDELIVDCPSININSYKSYLQSLIPKVMVYAEHKADLNHKSVAAASIIAKVTRDRIIEELKAEVGADFGSGYLSDPLTQSFLKTGDLKLALWRRSWKPYGAEAARRKQSSLADFR